MPLRKTAIAVPEDLLAAIDRAAEARGESRTQFITRVLRAAVPAPCDAAMTRQLDALFADAEAAAARRDETTIVDASGTVWSDERW